MSPATPQPTTTPATTGRAAKPLELDTLPEALAALSSLITDARNADTTLAPLTATAEQATRQWRAAAKASTAASAVAQQDQVRADAATARLQAAEQSLAALAVQDYESGMPASAGVNVITDPDAGALLDRIRTYQLVVDDQGGRVHQVAQQEQTADLLTARTIEARDRLTAITMQAAVDKAQAVAAENQEEQVVHALMARQAAIRTALARLLVHARGTQLTQVGHRLATAAASVSSASNAFTTALHQVSTLLPVATAKQGAAAVAAAEKEIGQPYSWGGGDASGPTLGEVEPDGGPTAGATTVGFDCSGLALYAWAGEGFALDHYTGDQWFEGRPVSRNGLRPGDLLFFATGVHDPATIHHVGLYVGNGRMIDAPQTGERVRYDDAFVPGYIGAVRP